MPAYNNGFPATYQPMYYQPTYPQPVQVVPQSMQTVGQPVQPTPQTVQPQMPQASGNSLIWVQGEAGAKSFLVAPNTTVPLWDSEAQRIFLKSTDAAGMPSMKILNYTIEETPTLGMSAQKVVNAPVTAPTSDSGVMGAEIKKALEGEIQAVKNDLEAIRSEMETFRGDLYGIAGKKPSAAKKKEGADNE